MTVNNGRRQSRLIAKVDNLSEEVKELSLNLAGTLAKIKGKTEDYASIEPSLMRLINNAVKVVQEISVILDAARNKDQSVGKIVDGQINTARLEMRLESILAQCNEIIEALAQQTEVKNPTLIISARPSTISRCPSVANHCGSINTACG